MNNSGLTYLSINGEDVHIRFGIPAVRMFLEKIGDDSNIIKNDIINETGIAHLIHFGYINNCMVEGVPPIKGFGFFLAYVEESFIDESIQKRLHEIVECYANSKYKESIIKKANERLEDIKKKKKGSTGMK